jgi:hypothetical protein
MGNLEMKVWRDGSCISTVSHRSYNLTGIDLGVTANEYLVKVGVQRELGYLAQAACPYHDS